MPQANRFQHQSYSATRPTSPIHCLPARPCAWSNSPEQSADGRSGAAPIFTKGKWDCPLDVAERMRVVGDSLRRRQVEAIYLVHGTFLGGDALGILAEVARVFPSAGLFARRIVKSAIDRVAGSIGNYTGEYAGAFEEAINQGGASQIPVRRFEWSSENHHLGRADGAVRLIDELASQAWSPGARVLLCGHSHAGNVFALMSNLLGGAAETVEPFFEAAEAYYRIPVIGRIDAPHWPQVRQLLTLGSCWQSRPKLDLVTFGTPVRYGWETNGYANLLHFLHHRPVEGLPEHLADFPPPLEDVRAARRGDYVQQFGIAGTNILPSAITPRTLAADIRLGNLVQQGHSRRDTLKRLRTGCICHEEGTTLLVDYGQPKGNITQHLAGHAVYTQPEMMVFHAEEIVRNLYEEPDDA